MTERRYRSGPAGRAEVATKTLDVLVAVGTDAHRFDRLMDWLQEWYASRPDRPSVLVQYGSSRAPEVPGATPFLEHDKLVQAMARAQVVVTHGGPASIAEARRHGHMPIVVARDPVYGEHVDDHQILFATRMAAQGDIRVCTTSEELGEALERGLADPAMLTATDRGTDPAAARAAAVAKVGRIVDDLIASKSRR
jgi:UDP-N-acetylglucosamine transferase subunit ALG13